MIILDYRDTRPLYEQIVDKFQMLILSGALEPNSRMPSVRSLAVELSINPNTIQRAYSELERNGFLYTVKGKGNYVAYSDSLKDVRKQEILEKLRDLKKEALGMGMTVKELTGFLEQEDTAAAGQKRDQSPCSGMRGRLKINFKGNRHAKKAEMRENMIELKNVSKSFDGIEALKNVSVTVREGEVFGLIGTNGAGKSTLLRLACGVFKPDDGLAIVDNMPVYDNVHAKAKLFFIADEPYFFNGATPKDMERYYSSVYRNFDRERFYLYLNSFGLESRRRISTFSKGMKKQLAILLGLSAKTEYLLCDETFDGLDPVMRQSVKKHFCKGNAGAAVYSGDRLP